MMIDDDDKDDDDDILTTRVGKARVRLPLLVHLSGADPLLLPRASPLDCCCSFFLRVVAATTATRRPV